MAHRARMLALVGLVMGPLLVTGSSLAAGAADPSDLGHAGAAAAAVGGTWIPSRAQTYANSNLIFNSVAAPAPGDVWAVGYRYTNVGGATEFRTVIEHSTGGDFQLVASPDREGAPAVDFLQDISGPSSDDLWAVGWSQDSGYRSHTLAEHWSGTSWTIAATPDPGGYGNILQGVTSIGPDDAWAVGARQDGFYQTPLTEHWNGATWTTVAAPDPAFCSGHSYLTDVAARPGKDVWATGTCSSSSRGGDQGYLLLWNGTRWVLPAVNEQIPTGASLSSISAFARTVWAVGTQRDAGAFAMVLKAGWKRVPVSAPDDAFAAVVARPGGNAWAVGTAPSPQPPFAGPGSMHLTLGGGTSVPVPVDFGSLRGATHDPAGRVWAVGTQLPGQYNTPLIVSRAG